MHGTVRAESIRQGVLVELKLYKELATTRAYTQC